MMSLLRPLVSLNCLRETRFADFYTFSFAVVESVQLEAPKLKKPNLAAALGSIGLADEAVAAPAPVVAAKETPASTTKKTRRVFKRLEVESGTKLSVKTLMQAAGQEKFKERHRKGDKAAKRHARHTLLQSVRYQPEEAEGRKKRERADQGEKDEDKDCEDWELLHMVDICRCV